jgi:hypothetical protein
MKSTIKKPKSKFDKLSTKCKKDNAHIKSRQNRNVQKVKLELPISPHRPDVLVADRCGDSKQPSLLQKPSCVVKIGERGNSIQQRCFLLLDIQC